MSNKRTDVSKTNSSHNYLNTQKSNAHTKVNGNLVQLWFGSANLPVLSSINTLLNVAGEENKKGNNFAIFKPIKSIIPKILLGGFLLSSANAAYAIPQIPASNGSAICAICAPPGWAIDNGTPDVSDRNTAATNGTSGGGTAWDAAPLPLPPNTHTTWLSLRDLGPSGNEEIVSTDMTGLIPGYSYELTMYTLTSTGPYSTDYNDAFRYKVGVHPIQLLAPLTHDTWGTTKFTFVADNATEHLQLLPGNNAAGGGTFESVQIAVTLNAIKVIPVGMDDSFTMSHDSTLLGNVLADNGGGVDQPGDEAGGTTTVTAYDAVSANGGAVVVNPDGSFSYIPATGFVGTDTFTYTVTDSNGATSTATATINVTNTAPVGVADSETTNEDTAVNIVVVGNDTDAENDTLTPTNITVPANGTAVLNADGVTIDYTPNADFNGTDTFTYTPNDGVTDGAPVTVTVTVAPVNDAPAGVADAATTNEDTAVNIGVVGNDTDVDGDALTPTNITPPANGTAVLNADGVTIDYTPNADFNGTDTFTYTPNDGSTNGAPVTVTVTVTPVNDAPAGVADAATTNEDTAINIGVVGNDTDTEGDALTPTNITPPANGTAVLNADGVTIDYTPNADFNGTDTFTYTPHDGSSDGAPVTVTVTVAPVNDAPAGVADAATTNEDTAVNIGVVGNDTDTEGDALTPTNITPPANGTAVLNADGVTIDYTPNADFNGTDTFTYTPHDGSSDGAPVTVTVTVTPVNDAPAGVDDAATTNEDTAVNIGVVGNDTDTDGDALTPTNITPPANGTAVLNADGVTIDYTPNADFNGTDTFTYTPHDGSTDGAPVTVTVTVAPVNDAPVGVADAATTNEDTAVNIGVVGNDTDTEGDALTPTNITPPANGTAVLNADGVTIDYTPNADFNGTDTFTYTPHDGSSDGAPITVTVTVTPVNDAPVGFDDAATTNEDTAVNIGVIGNDTDAEGDALTPTNITPPANGTAVLNADGVTIDYTPNADFNGTDTFTYTPNDGSTNGAPVTVTVTVAPVNDAPTGVDDAATTNEDTAVNIGVVGNDTDTDGDALTPTNITPPANGTAVLNADGVTIDYTPNADFNGTDTFTYTPHDGSSDGAPVTVTVTVAPVNDAPTGVDDAATTNEDTAVNIGVVGNDTDTEGDALTPTNITPPANGTAVLNADGVTIDYTPNADFNGTDTFTYTPHDGSTDGAPVTVTVTVTPVNDAPVGVDDAATTNEDTAVNIGVVGNDTDVDGDPLTPTNITPPANGTAVLNADGVTIDYTPNADFNGTDTFTYTPNDGSSDGAPVTVTVTVTPVNDAPVGVDDAATTNEDTAVNVGVVGNDTDADGDPLTPTNITPPANGTAVLNADGVTIDYTPNADFNGTDTFTYTPNDGSTDGAPVTVTVTVSPVNDAPIGVADAATTNEDTAVNIGVVGNDTDTDGDVLTPTNITPPANGTAVLNADGVTIDYTPNADFNGIDTFTYTPNDGSSDGAPVTVTVTVTPVNDAPVGVDDAATTNEDTAVNISVVGNDTDTEGDPLTPTNITPPANGTAVLNADGVTIDYTPNADFNGTDTFTYTPNDGSTDGVPVTVTVTVTPVNDAPVGVDDVATTNEDTAVNIGVVGNDTDTEGDPLTPTNITPPANGTAVLNADGVTIDYTPNADFNGTDTFTYTPNDGSSDGAPVTVTVTVTPVNDAPVGVDDVESTLEGQTVVIAVVDNDGDTENDVLTPSNITAPSNGTAVLSVDGTSIDYTPAVGFTGTDTFTYTPKDGVDAGNIVTVTVTVIPDTDLDGIMDSLDLDDDNDGIPDLVEQAGNPTRDTDGDGIIDSLDLDSDNDGILDVLEAGGVDTDGNGMVDDATDTDNDGLADVVDANPTVADSPADAVEAATVTTLPITDTDGDGTPNFQDVDSDNDGISDLVEGGLDPAVVDINNDGMIDTTPDSNGDGVAEGVNPNGIATAANPATSANPIVDTDNDGVPDYQDLDSDNDGLHDVEEAGGTDDNGDGVIDTPDTLVNPSTIPDTDGDGTPDPLEPNNPNLSAVIDTDGDGIIDDDTDTDGDGIPDVTDKSEGFGNNGDTDNDGIPDSVDLDDDNDGIPDLVEEAGDPNRDTDGDGIVDSKDLDSDNDGILDIVEAGGTDTNNDGTVDNTTDTDQDGLADVVDANPSTVDNPANAADAATVTTLPVTDTDGDGTPDFQDVDSDNDGISDLVEGGTNPALDTDGDGDIDSPVDENGIATTATPSEAPDTDNDGTPDYQDLDSDNDGLTDVEEAGGADTNGDGTIDTPDTLVDGTNLPDADGDGTPDPQEPNNPNLPASVDSDGDGIIDDATDTDGDGIPDVTDIVPDGFGASLDTDHDGIPDTIDLDDDNDGIPDLVEQASAQNGGDTDGDGIPDELDMDSDGDGISDLQESGLTPEQIATLDNNSDGIIDAPVGANGLADSIETDDTPSAGQDFNADGTVDTPADTDGDGRPDFQDLDSDNDGIHDLNEGSGFDPAIVDTNNDGVIDDNGTDADGDGIPDSIDSNDTFSGGLHNEPADTNSDGQPDYRDLDSDGDGIFDLIEGGTVDPAVTDADNDGVVDNPMVDSDNDGIPDSADSNIAGYGDAQPSAPVDTDGDNIPDYNDLDSDNDSLTDVMEAGHEDADGDGLFDVGGLRSATLPDADGDNTPDFLEVDSNDDGINDIEGTQNANLDADDDGQVDDTADADNDGVLDVVDQSPNQFGVSNDEKLETAVTGFGGSTGPMGIFMMTMLLAFRRFGGKKLLKRFLPMLLVAMFIVPGLLPSTAMADTEKFSKGLWASHEVVETESANCGTGSILENGFTPCNYVAGGFVMTHVDPEKEAGGWSTSDDMSTGFNLIAGRHFKPHWFGELSYTDMGEATLSNRNALLGKETISYKVPSLHIGYLLRAPEKQVNFYAKGGVSAIQNAASSASVPYEKQTNVQLTFGLGAQWQSEKSGLFARLGADFFDRDAIAAGLTVGYKFGGSNKKVRVIKRTPIAPVYKPAPKPIVKAKPVQKPVVKVAKKPVVRKPVKVVKKACRVGVLEGVNFHTNSARLTTKAEGILNGVVHKLKSCRANKVTIVGHTDSVGSAAKNLSLSQRRAASARVFLIKHGVQAHRLGSAGKGEVQPRADNKTKQGRAANRRVELLAK